MRAFAVAAGLWAVVVASRAIAARHSEAVEALYARRVYPAVARAVSLATGWTVFSLAEVIVTAGVFAIVLGALSVVVRGRWRRWTAAGVASAAARLLAGAAIAVLVFDVLWGFNYDRAPVAGLLGYDLAPAPAKDLAALSRRAARPGGRASRGTARGRRGCPPADGRPAGRALSRRARLRGRGGRFPSSRATPVRSAQARPVLPLMSYLGIGGIFIPFTCEANVNATLPDWEIPFTSAHELAHQRGFAREDEANYVGYLACRAHPDGTSSIPVPSLPGSTPWVLCAGGPAAYGWLGPTSHAPPGRDLAALAAWHRRYESRLGEVQERVNDAYLKTRWDGGRRAQLRTDGRPAPGGKAGERPPVISVRCSGPSATAAASTSSASTTAARTMAAPTRWNHPL